MSKISDIVNNTISEFPCNSDPHWTAKTQPEKEIKANPNTYDVFKDTMKTTANEEDVFLSEEEFFNKRKDKDVLTLDDIYGKSDIMKNVDHPQQVINQEINRPSHYGSKSGKDVIDWCEDFGIMNNAYVFNIFKYLCRAGKKNNNSELQDALKARIYLDRYIETLEKI